MGLGVQTKEKNKEVSKNKATPVFGISGKMGAGKSTFSALLKEKGACVFDADCEVRKIQTQESALYEAMKSSFPEIFLKDGEIARQKLRAAVLKNRGTLTKMERIIFPEIRKRCASFIAEKKAESQKLIVLDIPLLWSCGANQFCDEIFYVQCPEEIRQKRLEERNVFSLEERMLLEARQNEEKKFLTPDSVLVDGAASSEAVLSFIKRIFEKWHLLSEFSKGIEK